VAIVWKKQFTAFHVAKIVWINFKRNFFLRFLLSKITKRRIIEKIREQRRESILAITKLIAFHKVNRLVMLPIRPQRNTWSLKEVYLPVLQQSVPAITPPMISPNTSPTGICFSRIKKVTALANTTKNSARQTEPITYAGIFSFRDQCAGNKRAPSATGKCIHKATDACQPACSFYFIIAILLRMLS
jgi:hypothetical protein